MAEPDSPFPYEAHLAEIETIITELQQGEVDFGTGLARYRRAQQLLAACQAFLERTELELTQVTADADGLREQPLTIQEDADPPESGGEKRT